MDEVGEDTELLFLVLEHACKYRYMGLVNAITPILESRGREVSSESTIARRLSCAVIEDQLLSVDPDWTDVICCLDVLVNFTIATSSPEAPRGQELLSKARAQLVLAPLYKHPLSVVDLDAHLMQLQQYELAGAGSPGLGVVRLLLDSEAAWQQLLGKQSAEGKAFAKKLQACVDGLLRKLGRPTFAAPLASFCREIEAQLPVKTQLSALPLSAAASVGEKEKVSTSTVVAALSSTPGIGEVLRAAFRAEFRSEGLQAFVHEYIPSKPAGSGPVSHEKVAGAPVASAATPAVVAPAVLPPFGSPNAVALRIAQLAASAPQLPASAPQPSPLPPVPAVVSVPRVSSEAGKAGADVENDDFAAWAGFLGVDKSLMAASSRGLCTGDSGPSSEEAVISLPAPPAQTVRVFTGAQSAGAVAGIPGRLVLAPVTAAAPTEASKKRKLDLLSKQVSSVQLDFDVGSSSDDEEEDEGFEPVSGKSSATVRPLPETLRLVASLAANASAGKTKRRPFTMEEEAALSAGVNRFGAGNWSEILGAYKHIFVGRTSVNLKDKWRNMMKP